MTQHDLLHNQTTVIVCVQCALNIYTNRVNFNCELIELEVGRGRKYFK